MATATRIYIVTTITDGSVRLVSAAHPAAAIRHVAASTMRVEVASQLALVSAMSAGVKVEELTREQQLLQGIEG
jgi:hypothetical protein